MWANYLILRRIILSPHGHQVRRSSRQIGLNPGKLPDRYAEHLGAKMYLDSDFLIANLIKAGCVPQNTHWSLSSHPSPYSTTFIHPLTLSIISIHPSMLFTHIHPHTDIAITVYPPCHSHSTIPIHPSNHPSIYASIHNHPTTASTPTINPITPIQMPTIHIPTQSH